MKLYRALPHHSYDVHFGLRLLVPLGIQPGRIMQASMQSIVSMCNRFASLEDHVSRICSVLQIPLSEKAVITERLQSLVSAGLLMSAEDLLGRRCNISASTAPIRSINVLTSSRKDACLRAILSHHQNVRQYGREATLRVFDDSPLEQRAAYLDSLREFCTRCGVDIDYAGRLEKQRMISLLADRGIDRSTCEFGLFGFPQIPLAAIGANRNSMLLGTLGENAVSTDDDIQCRMASDSYNKDSIRIDTHSFPRNTLVFRDRSDLEQNAPWNSHSILDEYEILLAKPLKEFLHTELANLTDPSQDFCDHLLAALVTSDPIINVTMPGLVGDMGCQYSTWLLTSEGLTRQRMLASSQAYQQAISSREVLTMAEQHKISHHPFFMGTHFGFHNVDLPPFLPMGRGEDKVFASLAMAIDPTFLIGHIPLALLHDNSTAPPLLKRWHCRMAELLTVLIRSFRPVTRKNGTKQLQSLGRYLEELGRLPPADFWPFALHCFREQNSKTIASIPGEVETGLTDLPSRWQEDLLTWHFDYIHHLTDTRHIIPTEFTCHFSEEDARTQTQSFIREFGKFLTSWKDIVDETQSLAAEGTHLAIPLSEIKA